MTNNSETQNATCRKVEKHIINDSAGEKTKASRYGTRLGVLESWSLGSLGSLNWSLGHLILHYTQNPRQITSFLKSLKLYTISFNFKGLIEARDGRGTRDLPKRRWQGGGTRDARLRGPSGRGGVHTSSG
jgi:hypothetical protein